MRFAHFAHVWVKAGMTADERYDQLWRELVLADALGFDYGFCVEHHFSPEESLMSAPNLYAASVAARTSRIRVGAMGHIVPLHQPVRLVEEIALLDRMSKGRLEVGLVPGVTPRFFQPFHADFAAKREVTLEFIAFLKAVYAGEDKVSFAGRYHHFDEIVLSVKPMQRPHPPLWLETRDPPTLEFCAREGLDTGYFITFPRADAKRRYQKYLDDWQRAGWQRPPRIGYSTVVYVDETDARARDVAMREAGGAYRGFFGAAKTPAELQKAIEEGARRHAEKDDPGGAEIMRNILDPDYLLERELIVVGSPDTVAETLKRLSAEGLFNVFMGEFNFGALAEADLMRSIRLFGEAVIPALRAYEPF